MGRGDDKPPSKLTLSNSDLTNEQEAQLAELLSEFDYVVSVDMGKVLAVAHQIDTGQHPLGQCPID